MIKIKIFIIVSILSKIITGLSQVTTVVGTGGTTFVDNVRASSASINNPYGVFGDSVGNLFVTETLAYRIRRVDYSTQLLTNICGNGGTNTVADSANNLIGDGGKATSATLSAPDQMTSDTNGQNLYFSDRNNLRIRFISFVTNIITTIAGNGVATSTAGGQATSCSTNGAVGIFFDSTGQLYFGDITGQFINKIDLIGIVTHIAGSGATSVAGASLSGLIVGFDIGVEVATPATFVDNAGPVPINVSIINVFKFTDRTLQFP